jgi:hypothetical protein
MISMITAPSLCPAAGHSSTQQTPPPAGDRRQAEVQQQAARLGVREDGCPLARL